jgi:FdhE protein
MIKDTTSQILKKLKEQEKEEGSLPLLLEFYRQLLQIQSRTQKRLGTPKPDLSREAIHQRIEQGLPLVSLAELTLDWSLVPDVFVEVVAVFAKYPELFGEIPERLKKAGASRFLTQKAVKAWFTGKELPARLRDVVGENLIQTIIQATLQPFLASYAQALIGSVEQEFWRRGYCPICGGSPDLAYLEKEVGARWLLCARCDTEWLFQRLECPYCGTQEQKALAFFTDEKELYRLYVCEQCQCYLKAIDLRKTESEILLPLERLYTMDLDSQAKEYGYKPCQKPTVKKK